MKNVIIFSLVALVIGAALGYYFGYDIGYENAVTPVLQENEDDEETEPAAQEESFYGETGSISGYYMAEEESAWDEFAICDNLVIMDGSERLLDFYTDLIDSGNTVDYRNTLGRFVVTLDLTRLTDPDRYLVKNSSSDEPVDLVVRIKTPNGGGAPTCYSFIEILEVSAN